ncbi:MAG: response regulator [Thermoproteota archaeon]|nr:response regulator [Thermoproteota archaeon]
MSNQKRRGRILVVDDEPDSCLVYQTVLQGTGYECKSYTDSVKAMQEFVPNYYDLILLDIKMPKLNGFELCKNIRGVDKTIKVIFITASEDYYKNIKDQFYPELTSSTTTTFIQKPIENQELIKIVNETLARGSTNKKSSAINSS